MKTRYLIKSSFTAPIKHLKAIALFCLAVVSSFAGFAQVITPFAPRTSPSIYKIKGDFTMIGNSNMTLQTYGNNTNNSNNVMVYNDIDGVTETWNSSSAVLGLSTENGANPSCSNILFAGLYWTGRSGTTGDIVAATRQAPTAENKNFDKKEVKIKGPGAASYTTITATSSHIYYPTGAQADMFAGFSDVTQYVKTQGLGTYTVADIALVQGDGGGTGYYGGWSLIVVYENNLMKWRDITVFDGYAYVQGNTTISHQLPITGFQAVQTGQVNIKLGIMAGEGDVGISGDYFNIRNAANTAWVPLSHSTTTTGNFFNSSINTGGNLRSPSLQNNTGLDIAMFNLPNTSNSLIANSQTSTTFQYGSTQDTYIITNVAFAVDAYVPEVQNVLATVGPLPASVLPNDEVTFKVDIRNLGTEAVNNYKLIVPIPAYASYVAGSGSSTLTFTPTPSPNTISFDANYGNTGAIVYDFGTLPLPSALTPAKNSSDILGTFTFKLKATTNCIMLRNQNCSPAILLANCTSQGTGSISGTSFGNLPFITSLGSGACSGTTGTAPISISIDANAYIAANCNDPILFPSGSIATFNNCPLVQAPTISLDLYAHITQQFPPNTRFYQTPTGGTEYTAVNLIPSLLGNVTYYALPPGAGACYIPFIVNTCQFNVKVAGKAWVDKNGDGETAGENPIGGSGHTQQYTVVAVHTNGPLAGTIYSATPFAADGSYEINIPGNPVLQSGVPINAMFEIQIITTANAGSAGSAYSAPANAPTQGNSYLGSMPLAATNTYYYVTNHSATSAVKKGKYNEKALHSFTLSPPYASITDLDLGVQTPAITTEMMVSLPMRPTGTFWQLDNDDQLLSGVDIEDGLIEQGGKFRVLSNPSPIGGLSVKLAYDANGNGPDLSDIIDASNDPDDNVFFEITNYDRSKLYVYFESGMGTYSGNFNYAALDDADATIPDTYTFTAILPISGLELAGSYNNNKASLKWKTLSTDDVDHFILERGTSTQQFTQVAILNLNGKEYNFTDDLASFSGSDAYYRVKLVRKNGTVSISNIISLKLGSISGLQLMPTLVRNDLQVRFNNQKTQEVVIRVVNVSGQVVMNYRTSISTGNATINLNGFEKLSNGTYSVQVFTGTSVQQGKIIVQH